MIYCEQHQHIHLSLTPGFSPVIKGRGMAEPFQRFCSSRKTVETVCRVAALLTGLKPGVKEKSTIFAA